MRTALCLSLFFLTALPAIAGDVRTINASCENAIVKAEVLAAQRKWWPDRPDPKAPALSVRTHANFAKNYLVPLGLGIVWSHEKVGEMAFEDLGQSCRVISNGHPADVVLSDLAKAEFPAPVLARQTDVKEVTQTLGTERTQITTRKCPQGTHWGDSPNGEPICVWSH
jgi:hypothetical protein